eukprot:COSAG06_NODE_8132_length_2265_cov_5.016159_1_plen_280_part_10
MLWPRLIVSGRVTSTQRASIRAQRELSKRHAEESRVKLKEQNERSDQVVRAWAKKQGNLNKTKNRARRNRIARDQRFIEDSKAVVAHVRTWESTPPLELMHASTALAKMKKEEKRAKQEGRPVSGLSSGGEDDEPETPQEIKTVMEMKASITVRLLAPCVAAGSARPLGVCSVCTRRARVFSSFLRSAHTMYAMCVHGRLEALRRGGVSSGAQRDSRRQREARRPKRSPRRSQRLWWPPHLHSTHWRRLATICRHGRTATAPRARGLACLWRSTPTCCWM